MRPAGLILISLLMVASPMEAHSQEIGELIIDPEISGYTLVPMGEGSRIIRSDSRTEPPANPNRVKAPRGVDTEYPSGALIKGMVPDPYRGWAVAVTRDREEFERALPEYRRLIAEGRTREAREVLHVSTDINVSTKVESFRDREKIGELPEKIGRFFFSLSTREFKKYGGYLTFLSYTPDPEDPIPVVGKDIGERIHGIIQVETTEGKEGFQFGYGMKVILADTGV